MNEVAQLQAIEQIKQLKARYCRLLDEKQWDAWRDLFTEAATLRLPQWETATIVQGRDAIVATIRPLLEEAETSHHVHAPEIELLSDDRATGVWALQDRLWWPEGRRNSFGWSHIDAAGHYHELYRRTGQGWRIEQTELRRLYRHVE